MSAFYEWQPLREHYPNLLVPPGWKYYVLTDGDNGPMIANFYPEAEPGCPPEQVRNVVKVATPTGHYPAAMLGAKNMMVIPWPPSPEPEDEPAEEEGGEE